MVLGLAALAALLDRATVLCVANAVASPDTTWRIDLAWALAAIAGILVFGRWARIAGLTLSERAADQVVLTATNNILKSDWRRIGSDTGRLGRIGATLQVDAGRAVTALPSLVALPVTAVWLSLVEPRSLLIIGLLILIGAALLRRESTSIRASEAVQEQAEAAFDSVTDMVLAARSALHLAATDQADVLAQAVWPAVDDTARAASLHARAHARATALFGWLSLLAVIVLLTFASGVEQSGAWGRALIIVAATLHHLRQAYLGAQACGKVGVAAVEIQTIADGYPRTEQPAGMAPSRWSVITFRNVATAQYDTPSVFLAAIGPLDLEIRRGEIVAITGSNPDDRGALLHVLCGLLPPDSGTVLLDGRPIPPSMLRGLCGAALDRGTRSSALPLTADSPRTAMLLGRFGLAPNIMNGDITAPIGESESIRLGIVTTEITDRPIRLYDELATRLEPRFRAAFALTLREARARGRTCIVATGVAEVIAEADRVLHMQDGLLLMPAEAMP